MTRGWTIQRQLIATFSLLLLLFVGQGGQSLWTIRHLNQQAERDSLALAATVELGSRTMELSAAADMVVVAAYKRDVKQIDEEWGTVEPTLKKLGAAADALVASTNVPENRDRARKIVEAMQQWRTLAAKAVDEGRAGRPDTASAAMDASEQYSDTIASHLVEQVQASELSNADTTRAAAARTAWLVTVAGACLGLMVAGLVVLVIRRIDRSLRRVAADLRDGEEQVLSAASQVAGSAQALSEGATEEAASLQQTAASMKEMASMTRQNAENSTEAAKVMNEVDGLVHQSNSVLAEMTASMSAIQESSEKISRIIKTIDEIAFQTNILALNAAVEAARAGETGMGFAVVADEVRNLAQRSAQAARDTAALIEEAIVRSKTGALKVEHVSTAISAITVGVTRVKGLVERVNAASRQQAQGIEQVTQSVAQMDRVTQTTAATAEESAAASEELNAQAATAITTVGRLEAMIGASQSSPFDGRPPFERNRPHPLGAPSSTRMPRRISDVGAYDTTLRPTGTSSF